MRGQTGLLPFLMIFIVISIIAIGAFLTVKGSEFEVKINAIEFANFKKTLDNRVSLYTAKPRGSEEVFSFNVPKGMEKICFRGVNHNEFAYTDLEYRTLEEGNVFFFPSEFGTMDLDADFSDNPFCVTTDRILSLRFQKDRNLSISSERVEPYQCKELLAGTKGKINILFMGIGFSDTDLTNMASFYIEETFKSIEPFASNIESFNFYQASAPVTGCEIAGHVNCDTAAVRKLASVCPHDYVVILVSVNRFSNFPHEVRSSSVSNIVKINTLVESDVLAHELGHSIGNLADEYIESIYKRYDFSTKPNCDASASCSKWSHLRGEEKITCVPGCSTTLLNKPTHNSLMNEYWRTDGDQYWAVNEEAILSVIEAYK